MSVQGTPVSSGGGGMTLTEARAVVLQFARNAPGATAPYSEADVDRAIQFVGNHFARTTGALRQRSQLSLTNAAAGADASGLAGFRPEMLLDARIDGQACALAVVTWEELTRRQVQCPASGAPRYLAFETWSSGGVYPTPDDDYTLVLRWRAPFTAWAAGTGTPDDVTLNVPADWLAEILPYGPPAVLQHNEPEQLYASSSWKRYLEVAASLAGAGGYGAQTAERANPWACG